MTVKECIVVPLYALAALLILSAAPARAQSPASSGLPGEEGPVALPSPGYTRMPTERLQVPSVDIDSAIPLAAEPISPQTAPDVNVPPAERKRFEHSKLSAEVLVHQWSPTEEVPPESVISERYIGTSDQSARAVSLKEAVFLALSNNPTIAAAQLNPLLSLESVRESEATFDPNLTSRLDEEKTVTPATSILQTGGASAYATKDYDWNFAVSKTLATTNGTLALTFDNNRLLSNSAFASINPAYTPSITMSLSQPLLQNFGLNFATINVRIAEINQESAQFNYEQNLSDFILKVGGDYWNVVGAEESLAVAREAYKLAADVVRQNEISVRVGTLAPLDLQEAQSTEATNAAGVYQAENTLQVARAGLRQDLMLNPSHVFLPEQIQPTDKPTGASDIKDDEEQSLEYAMEYRPELASMRQLIRSLLLQVKFAENQTLPQLNLGAQIGLTSVAGLAKCSELLGGSTETPNCTIPTVPPTEGVKLPFGRNYSDALNNIWSFGFYNYAIALSFQRPLTNDAATAALAQAKIEYEQQRLQYRALISQIVLDVETQLTTVNSDIKTAHANKIASDYARESLRAEEERFRVGLATTHDLLQYQEELVAALGNEVSSDVSLEVAKLALRHAQGMLLHHFNVTFEPQNPHQGRWYTAF
jgi:outer membrane protein